MYRFKTPILPNIVKDFWIFDGSDFQNNTYSIYPDGYVDIVFRIEIINNHEFSVSDPYFIGFITKPRQFRSGKNVLIAGIRLKAGGANRLFDIPEYRFRDMKVPVDIPETGLLHINQTVQNRKKLLDTIFTNLTTFLRPHLHKPFSMSKFEFARDHIIETDGCLDISEIAKQTGYSLRHFERRFKDEIGIHPKKLAGIRQFRTALKHIRNTSKPLLNIAYETGYYDHAHLTKSIKKYTGKTPTQLRCLDI